MKSRFLLKDSVLYNISSRGISSFLWDMRINSYIFEEQVRLKVSYAIYYGVNKNVETFVNDKII